MAVAVAISVCNDNMEYANTKVKDEPNAGSMLDINQSVEKMSLTETSPSIGIENGNIGSQDLEVKSQTSCWDGYNSGKSDPTVVRQVWNYVSSCVVTLTFGQLIDFLNFDPGIREL